MKDDFLGRKEFNLPKVINQTPVAQVIGATFNKKGEIKKQVAMEKAVLAVEYNLIQIKKLKWVSMYFNTETQGVMIESKDPFGKIETINLTRGEIFPVLRGLVSATQRFYRKKTK